MQGESWGHYYHSIASQMALYRESNRLLVEAANLRPGMTVVDLGCGSGLTALAALDAVPEGLKLILADKSRSMIDEARKVVGDRAEAFHVVRAEDIATVVPEQSVDRVLCNLSMEYFKNPEEVLRRVKDILKAPLGRLCFTYSGTFFNTYDNVVTPEWAYLKRLHQRGLLEEAVPDIELMPNERATEGNVNSCGLKCFYFKAHEIQSALPDTEPGGELYNQLRLYPVLPGEDRAEAAEASVALLPGLKDEIDAMQPRWRVAHFMAQGQMSTEDAIRLVQEARERQLAKQQQQKQ